jgi:predicted small lipoprotein YifL
VAFEQISGKALASLLLSSTLLNTGPLLLPPAHAAATTTTTTTTLSPHDYDDTIKKRILITGCNSGIGFDAAQRMVVRGHEVVLACVSILYLEWFLYLYAVCVLLLQFQLCRNIIY